MNRSVSLQEEDWEPPNKHRFRSEHSEQERSSTVSADTQTTHQQNTQDCCCRYNKLQHQTTRSVLRWILRFCMRGEKSAAPGTLPPRPRPPGRIELFGRLLQLLKTQHKPALSRQLDHLRDMRRATQPLLQMRAFFSMGHKANQRRHEAGS